MRFSLLLRLKNNKFPIEYRRVILSYIKNALTQCNDGKYYDEFFGDITPKDYCFSVIFPGAKFSKDEIEIKDNQIRIIFSTDDRKKTGLKLFSAFIGQKNKVFPLENENYMILQSIINVNRDEILNNRAIFKTALGSGICVRDHDKETNKDRYYIYSDEEFREKLKVTIKNELINAGFLESEADKISVNPIQCKKAVAKHYKRFIDISLGMFEISGSKYILQYLYDVGIGSRKSAGFGMLDLITQDLQ